MRLRDGPASEPTAQPAGRPAVVVRSGVHLAHPPARSELRSVSPPPARHDISREQSRVGRDVWCRLRCVLCRRRAAGAVLECGVRLSTRADASDVDPHAPHHASRALRNNMRLRRPDSRRRSSYGHTTHPGTLRPCGLRTMRTHNAPPPAADAVVCMVWCQTACVDRCTFYWVTRTGAGRRHACADHASGIQVRRRVRRGNVHTKSRVGGVVFGSGATTW